MRRLLLLGPMLAACASADDPFGLANPCGFSDAVVLPKSDVPGLCARSGWCWMHPGPQGNDLRAIWGSAKTDVWTAGDGGVLLHFDGTDWGAVDLGTRARLNGLWGSGPRDVWLVGDGSALFHFDGASWSPVTPASAGDLRAVYGFATNDVWAAGTGKDPAGQPRPLLLHWDGMRWASATPSTTSRLELTDVWGAAPQDVWAAGGVTAEGRNGLLHYDGRAWTEVPIEASWFPNRLGGSSSGDVWGVGDGRTLIHWDGMKWTAKGGDTVSDNEVFLDVWAPAAADAYALSYGGHIFRWNGETWALDTLRMGLVPDALSDFHPGPSAAWRAPDGEIFAAGRQGVLVRGKGDDWTRTGSGWNVALSGLFGTGEKDLWLAGDARSTPEGPGPFTHYNGDTFTRPRCSALREIRAIWGLAPDVVWSLDRSQRLHRYAGAGWAEEKHGLAKEGVSFFTGFATSENDLWIAGTIFGHYNGAAWNEVPPPAGLTAPLHVDAMSGTAPDDVWAAGDPRITGRRTQLLHFDGTRWTDQSSKLPLQSVVAAVWARAKDDVWIGGFEASVAGPVAVTYHWDGTAMNRVAAPPEMAVVRAIHGRAANDVWAVGGGGTAARWDGTRWTLEQTGAADELIGVWAGPEATWAIGGASILRRPK